MSARRRIRVRLHPHALQRLGERGAAEEEVIVAVMDGEPFPAKFDRTGFRRNFAFDETWRGRRYATKQLEVFAVREGDDWLALTVLTKYF